MTCDVVVAGSGPAGSMAARTLAARGRSVVIVDRAAGPVKIGESLPGAAVRLLRSEGVPVSFDDHAPVRGNLSAWGSDHLDATDFVRDPDGAGWRLDRARFDSSLLAAAVGMGARLVESRVRGARRDGPVWCVALEDGSEVRTAWLVDASGRSAAVLRQLGVPRVRDEGLAAVCAVGEAPEEAFDRTVVEAAPDGWWYGAVLPQGRAVLVRHVRPQDANEARATWHEGIGRTSHIRRWFPAERFPVEPWTVAAEGAKASQFTGPGWIACGDAALSFDPLASQGIFTALYGGLMAARSIVDGRPETLTRYVESLNSIREKYRTRVRAMYAAERRWPDAPFWSERRSSMESPRQSSAPSPRSSA